MDVSFCAGDPDSHCHITAADSMYRCHFCKLDRLLCLRHLK